MSKCLEAEEGVREDCCLHELPITSKNFPGSVCCWCGDLYVAEVTEVVQHGEYAPKITVRTKFSRRVRMPRK
jgi:hypothetical protein